MSQKSTTFDESGKVNVKDSKLETLFGRIFQKAE